MVDAPIPSSLRSADALLTWVASNAVNVRIRASSSGFAQLSARFEAAV